MSFQTPTAWLAVVVHKIVRQLNDDGGVDIGVICQWDGQDVTLLIDSSPETDIDRSILACLDVGDRFSVKGRMLVTPILDNGIVALRVSLVYRKIEGWTREIRQILHRQIQQRKQSQRQQ